LAQASSVTPFAVSPPGHMAHGCPSPHMTSMRYFDTPTPGYDDSRAVGKQMQGQMQYGQMQGEMRHAQMQGERRDDRMQVEMQYGQMQGEQRFDQMQGEKRYGENRPLMDAAGDDSDGDGNGVGHNSHASWVKAGALAQQCRRYAGPLLLLMGAIALACNSAFTAMVAFKAVNQEDFQTFSALAWQNWFPSFSAFFLVFGLLALCSLAVAILSAWLGFKGPRRFMRTFALGVASLGLLILCLAIFVWFLQGRARPYVAQAANLICQDVNAFGCLQQQPTQAPAAGLPPIAMTPNALGAGPQEPEEVVTFPSGRRLGTADAVVGYQNSFGAEKQQAANPEFCEKLQKLCVAPPAFDANTACVCNGLSDPSKSVVPGHWNSSSGAFCQDWGSDGKGQWCFVSGHQLCHKDKQIIVNNALQNRFKSDGPCTDEVDSRSQLVLDGHDAMLSTIKGVMLMGLLLVLLAFCSGLVYCLPDTRGSDWQQREYYGHESEQLRQRFLEAQRYATDVLTEETSEEMKRDLYAYYNQANKGDVQGSRPGFFSFSERSRYDAWARLRGMSQAEAMQGYINAVVLLDRA